MTQIVVQQQAPPLLVGIFVGMFFVWVVLCVVCEIVVYRHRRDETALREHRRRREHEVFQETLQMNMAAAALRRRMCDYQ